VPRPRRRRAARIPRHGDEAGIAASLNRRGVSALYAADYADAERLLTSALAISTTRGDREACAEHLANLGNVRFFIGQYGDAARPYDEALNVTSTAAGEAWTARRRRWILANQATLFQRLGRDQEALAAYTALGSAPEALRRARSDFSNEDCHRAIHISGGVRADR
jgi:tetratricopeptide (TPR) repeat protein